MRLTCTSRSSISVLSTRADAPRMPSFSFLLRTISIALERDIISLKPLLVNGKGLLITTGGLPAGVIAPGLLIAPDASFADPFLKLLCFFAHRDGRCLRASICARVSAMLGEESGSD